jgi:hypothetical protein
MTPVLPHVQRVYRFLLVLSSLGEGRKGESQKWQPLLHSSVGLIRLLRVWIISELRLSVILLLCNLEGQGDHLSSP